MKQTGFSFIEVMIYSSLLCVISIISFSWVTRMVQDVHKVQHKSNEIIMAHTILQRLSQDVQIADPLYSQWVSANQRIQFHQGNHSIMWALEKNKLYRIQNSARSLIATGLKELATQIHRNGSLVTALDIHISFEELSLRHTIQVHHA